MWGEGGGESKREVRRGRWVWGEGEKGEERNILFRMNRHMHSLSNNNVVNVGSSHANTHVPGRHRYNVSPGHMLCTLYGVHCTLYGVQCTLYGVPCTL